VARDAIVFFTGVLERLLDVATMANHAPTPAAEPPAFAPAKKAAPKPAKPAGVHP
jgi:hypothetical protein